jgi:hypothetical protein
MHSDIFWPQIRGCFLIDDGSLPTVEITHLSRTGVVSIYQMIRERSHLSNKQFSVANTKDDSSIPIEQADNAALQVVEGAIYPFQHDVEGIIANGVELPEIGVYVDTESIELVYRMGPEWTDLRIAGFFELLGDCVHLDPNAVIKPSDQEPPPLPELFQRAWNTYIRTRQDI